MLRVMLQFYDKALAVSVLALAALTAPAQADVASATLPPAACDLTDGYGAGVHAFNAEVAACLNESDADAHAETATRISALTERHRARFDMAPLEMRESLDAAARAHALDMAARGYAAHADDLGRSHSQRLRMIDRSLLVGASGANIVVVPAGMDPIDIFNALIGDPVNADNLTRDAFTHSGLGLAASEDGKLYVVQLFAQVDGELDQPLPLALPPMAELGAHFTDARFEQAGWRLERADGVALTRGGGETLTASARTLEPGTAYLDIEAVMGTDTYRLAGPAVATR